jgi:hypothetical protein
MKFKFRLLFSVFPTFQALHFRSVFKKHVSCSFFRENPIFRQFQSAKMADNAIFAARCCGNYIVFPSTAFLKFSTKSVEKWQNGSQFCGVGQAVFRLFRLFWSKTQVKNGGYCALRDGVDMDRRFRFLPSF